MYVFHLCFPWSFAFCEAEKAEYARKQLFICSHRRWVCSVYALEQHAIPYISHIACSHKNGCTLTLSTLCAWCVPISSWFGRFLLSDKNGCRGHQSLVMLIKEMMKNISWIDYRCSTTDFEKVWLGTRLERKARRARVLVRMRNARLAPRRQNNYYARAVTTRSIDLSPFAAILCFSSEYINEWAANNYQSVCFDVWYLALCLSKYTSNGWSSIRTLICTWFSVCMVQSHADLLPTFDMLTKYNIASI